MQGPLPSCEIIEGDVLDGLGDIPDRSIDLVMTSPPYAEARARQYGGTPADQYVEWYRPIARELLRVLKKSGSYILNIKEGLVDGERSTYVIDLVKAHREEGWRWHDEFIWHKPSGFVGDFGTRLPDAWEHCYQFARSPAPYIDKNANRTPISKSTAGKRAYSARLRAEGRKIPSEERTYPSGITRRLSSMWESDLGPTAQARNVVQVGVLAGAGAGHANHPAAFPPKIPAWFIALLCPAAGTVLDPFMGSGTTLVAADRLGRPSIGIDRSPEYCKMAAVRIAGDRSARRRKNG